MFRFIAGHKTIGTAKTTKKIESMGRTPWPVMKDKRAQALKRLCIYKIINSFSKVKFTLKCIISFYFFVKNILNYS